jgi:hypothetical protein
MSYEQKYLKYKQKYIALKEQSSFVQGDSLKQKYLQLKRQIGGDWGNADDLQHDCLQHPINISLDLSGWEKKDMTVADKKFRIIRRIIDADPASTKPDLVAMASYSLKSFCGSSKIITECIEELKGKFKGVYIINLEAYKPIQETRCAKRNSIYKDKIKEEIPKFVRRDHELCYHIHLPEIRLSEETAVVVNNLIINPDYLGLTNVHLLGKCSGASVAIEVLSLSPIYKALYLAVPGIPNHLMPLLKVPKDRLDKMKIIIGWNENDRFEFKWGISIDEKLFYDAQIREIDKDGIINYQPHIFSPGNGHEINPELVRIIGAS